MAEALPSLLSLLGGSEGMVEGMAMETTAFEADEEFDSIIDKRIAARKKAAPVLSLGRPRRRQRAAAPAQTDDNATLAKEMIHAAANAIKLETRTRAIPGVEEITALARVLAATGSTETPSAAAAPADMLPGSINYEAFCEARTVLQQEAPGVAAMLTAELMLSLPRDQAGCVLKQAVLQRVAFQSVIERARTDIAAYATASDGQVLLESDLETFFTDVRAEVPGVRELTDVFFPFYMHVAVRGLLFTLDRAGKGSVPLRTLAGSRMFAQFAVLWQAEQEEEEEEAEAVAAVVEEQDGDEEDRHDPDEIHADHSSSSSTNGGGGAGTKGQAERAARRALGAGLWECLGLDPPTGSGGNGAGNAGGNRGGSRSCWFTAESCVRVYRLYLRLDDDRDGMLGARELRQMNEGAISGRFIDSVLSQRHTYGGQLDFRGFLDLLLALEQPQEPQAIRFLYRVLASPRTGKLDRATVRYYLQEVCERYAKVVGDGLSVNDVVTEWSDMVAPRDGRESDGVSLQDVLACPTGHTALLILADVNALWMFDQREQLATAKADDDEHAAAIHDV